MADVQLSVDSEHNAVTPHSQLATSTETPPMRCCCGSLQCIFLRHNYSLLDNLERDVHQAARMGQALLARHESYMADAERDRNELTARIEQLENENKELETMNAKTIEENRQLLDQLEALNSTVADSEGEIKSLEATLLSSQQTIRRLEAETARAEALERQIAALEQEQVELQSTLTSSRDETKSALSRWKRAERGLNDLQEQLERMEKEAKEEREHHLEMMSRIEKQREMEKELNTAAGRLKGAAAAKSMNLGNGGTNVVGHFVRDLLQDNANLQYGIAELRQMLMNSHDEIQTLRDQLENHQPLGDVEESATPTLSTELEPNRSPMHGDTTPPKVSQELHIHHHYHVTAPKQEMKKPRKKRLGLTHAGYIPPAISRPSTPPNGLFRHSSDSRPRKDSLRSTRWSVISEQPSEMAASSAPSSPRSNNRNSVFDQPAGASFPGSPSSSIDAMSPLWRPTHKKQPSTISSRSFQAPTSFPFGPAISSMAHPIVEESDVTETAGDLSLVSNISIADDEASSRGLSLLHDETSEDQTEAESDQQSIRSPTHRHLRRAMSHESIVSLSGGLDIHTLKSRPSQLTIRRLGTGTTVTGGSMVTARPLISRDSSKRSSALLRDYNALPSSAASLRSQSSSDTSSIQQQPESSKLGRWVGWRPWGGRGNGESGGSKSRSTSARPTGRSVSSTRQPAGVPEKESGRSPSRPPGINQSGAVPGFSGLVEAAKKKTPTPKTIPDVVDHEALQEGLSE
ncbi:hypothetical protein GGS20DRAFT_413048 [Poronia punctata]|nr:hypothetical protein GGS20DRAFT_413048 [Poronia punctata]